MCVDNDQEKSARSIIQSLNISHLHNISYHVETSRGIASARNRLLKEAINAQADFIAFIDDDEFPKSDWLLVLFNALLKYSAAVATGPVIALTEERGRLFQPLKVNIKQGACREKYQLTMSYLRKS